uniref:Uncharacterized protein n=1 Tax=Amphimedon queenslandica TaxID=400682 RepID=A0A1X7T1G0_AMPQE
MDKNLIGMEKKVSETFLTLKEQSHDECKEEKAECIEEKEDLKKDIQRLSKQATDLNLEYTKCDSERPAHAECKEDKRKCLQETRDLNDLNEQLKRDKAALDVKYTKCDTERVAFDQCKVDKRELKRINKNLEADLKALNIEAITLNITHSSENKELTICDRRLHVCKVNMLDYLGRYETCLKDKGNTKTESQKNDVICKVELAKCEANLRQAIDTSSQCQEKLASCRWC